VVTEHGLRTPRWWWVQRAALLLGALPPRTGERFEPGRPPRGRPTPSLRGWPRLPRQRCPTDLSPRRGALGRQPSVPRRRRRSLRLRQPPPPDRPGDRPVVAPAAEAQRQLVTASSRPLGWWQDAAPDRAVPAWPANPDGSLDIAGSPRAYQLSALFCPRRRSRSARHRLPALVERPTAFSRAPISAALDRRRDGDAHSPSGEEARSPRFARSSWTGSAWVGVAQRGSAPTRPRRDLTPTVLTTIGLRPPEARRPAPRCRRPTTPASRWPCAFPAGGRVDCQRTASSGPDGHRVVPRGRRAVPIRPSSKAVASEPPGGTS